MIRYLHLLVKQIDKTVGEVKLWYAHCAELLLWLQFSYMVLNQGISPVTFSVGNTMKRVAVVVSSVLFFKNPVALLNWVGSGIAIFGTFLYSLAKDKAQADAKASNAATS